MIRLTEKAAEQVKVAIHNRSMPEKTTLRVGIDQPVDQHPKLALSLDPNGARPDDMVETTGDTSVVAHQSLAAALGDGQLDFREEAGFVLQRKEPGSKLEK